MRLDWQLPLDGDAVERAVKTYRRQNLPTEGWTLVGRASGPHTVNVRATRTVHLPVFGVRTVVATASATDRTEP